MRKIILKYVRCFGLLLAAGMLAWTVAVANAAELTPYDRNPNIFLTPEEANARLADFSSDLQISAVQWLHDRYVGASPAMEKKLMELPDIQEHLTHILFLASRPHAVEVCDLLGAMGSSARRSLPSVALLEAGLWADKANDHWTETNDVEGDMMEIAGGPDKLANVIGKLLDNPSTPNRPAIAFVLGMRYDPTSCRTYSHAQEYRDSLAAQTKWQAKFGRSVISALARHIADPDKDVCLAALQSIVTAESYTDYASAPWEQIVKPAANAAASSDPFLRSTALRALARCPADVSHFVESLRPALRAPGDDALSAKIAVAHAVLFAPERASRSMIEDLHSSDVDVRRNAVADLAACAEPLVSGAVFISPSNADQGAEFAIWNGELMSDHRDAELVSSQFGHYQRSIVLELRNALNDEDEEVRTGAAQALLAIGDWATRSLGYSHWRRQVQCVSELQNALPAAAIAVEKGHPDLGAKLHDRARRLVPMDCL